MAKKSVDPGKVYCVLSLDGKLVSAHQTLDDAEYALDAYRDAFDEFNKIGKIVPGKITY